MAGLAYPSTVWLIGINLIPLALVWTGRWDGFDVLLAYWWEGVVVAGIAIIKAAVAREREPDTEATFNLYDLPTGVHLVISLLMSGLYLLAISSLALTYDGSFQSLNRLFEPSFGDLFGWVGRELFGGGLIFYAVAQALPYLYSFVNDFLRRAEYQRVREVFETSLIRVSAIELTVLVLVLATLSIAWFPLWLVVVIKMVLDGALHLIERMGSNPSNRPSAARSVGP